MEDLRKELARLKDLNERQFNGFKSNFYVVKAALRYYSENQGLSFNASRLADEFPLSVPAAGSSLKMLSELGVIEPRNDSGSADRYMPRDVDLGRLLKVEEVLVEQLEIEKFEKQG
ncbi:MAG: hypothetical protein ACLFTA_01870 [Candidatus Nanohaloarchaea archaeon]